MKKIALILGVTGQDGSYAAELLLSKKYKVFGLVRKSATGNTKNIKHLIQNKKIINKNFVIIHGDLLDYSSIYNAINSCRPDEIYNFADQDHVRWSFEIPSYSFNTTCSSVIQILECIKIIDKNIKYFQPVSSNMFGLSDDKRQNEKTELKPNSIYAVAKAATFLACKMYQNVFHLKIYGAIFYNHESPRRSEEYVTQKIIKAASKIFLGKQKHLYLGDISAKIDWGYAKDYVEAAWKIMQQKKPDFFIISSGKTHTVKYFVEQTFKSLNLDYKKYLKVDKKLLRPSKTKTLVGNFFKAKKTFGYKNKTPLKKLIKIMLDFELKKNEKD
jgi:GDPmannose 4,6-dehydratase|tara:strand:- start:5300 stop:6286 length:987 start_codon:yes stop_codon:yes gene_type:complete